MIVPARLQQGDALRVVAPSKSLGIIDSGIRRQAVAVLEKMGLKVSFSENCESMNEAGSSSVRERVEDLHEAFADPKVRVILTAIGGNNSHELLPHLDYGLIRKNPKILCGFSDITALQSAITAKAGLVTYSGPHFSTFGCLEGNEFTCFAFQSHFFSSDQFELKQSSHWSDDAWYLNQNSRQFNQNPGPSPIRRGVARGQVVGGNLQTLVKIADTEFLPKTESIILFLEEEGSVPFDQFLRNLKMLAASLDRVEIKGLCLGRFERKTNASLQTLRDFLSSDNTFRDMPVVANLNFGHTMPLSLFPIGGTCHMISDDTVKILFD